MMAQWQDVAVEHSFVWVYRCSSQDVISWTSGPTAPPA